MPSFCSVPSELVRQHPKRNIHPPTHPAPPRVDPTYALALSLACPSQDARKDVMCVLRLCAHMHVLVRGKRREQEALGGLVAKEYTQCAAHSVHECQSICVQEGWLCCIMPKCWKWQGGTVRGRSLLIYLQVSKKAAMMEPCHWLVDTFSKMSVNPKISCQLWEPNLLSVITGKEQKQEIPSR